MTKSFKKVIAVLCAIAMVVTSVTVYNAKAAESATEEWVALEGDAPDTYFYEKSTMELHEIVNIQKPGWAEEKGIYMNVSSGISEVTVNGVSEGVAKIEGAGVIVYLSALTKNINEVNITHAQGTGYVKIKNASISGGEVDPPQESSTPEPSSEIESSTPGEVTGDWVQAEINKDPWADLGAYTYYVGDWGDEGGKATASYKGGDQLNNFAFRIDSNTKFAQFLVQVKTKGFVTEAGKDYKYVVEFNSSTAGSVLQTKIDGVTELVDHTLVEGSNKIEGEFTATGESSEVYFQMGYVAVGTELDFTKVEVVAKEAESSTPGEVESSTPAEVESSTPAEVESSTPAEVESSTPAEVESSTPDAKATTAPQVTTTAPKATTEAPKTTTTAPKKALGKTTVKKASKKLSAKRVKITFKKVKGAKKYQVQISKTKKFKKVLVKKTVKKVKVTITNKKLANKKKLFVRVKAVGAKKWSKVKKIKIKK